MISFNPVAPLGIGGGEGLPPPPPPAPPPRIAPIGNSVGAEAAGMRQRGDQNTASDTRGGRMAAGATAASEGAETTDAEATEVSLAAAEEVEREVPDDAPAGPPPAFARSVLEAERDLAQARAIADIVREQPGEDELVSRIVDVMRNARAEAEAGTGMADDPARFAGDVAVVRGRSEPVEPPQMDVTR